MGSNKQTIPIYYSQMSHLNFISSVQLVSSEGRHHMPEQFGYRDLCLSIYIATHRVKTQRVPGLTVVTIDSFNTLHFQKLNDNVIVQLFRSEHPLLGSIETCRQHTAFQKV